MGVVIGQEYVDFINELKGVVDLAGVVLSKLDVESLKAAELVSKAWRKTISEARAWECILKKEITSKPAWNQIYKRMMAEPSQFSADKSDMKQIYCEVQHLAKALEHNWSKGIHGIRGKRIVNPSPKNSSEFMIMDDQSIMIGIKNCGSIKVLNRKTLEFEQDFPKHGPGLSFLLMLDSETLISGCRKEGILKVWDKNSRNLLHTVVVRKAESAIITELVTSNGLVVAVAHSTSGDPWKDNKSKMIIWRADPTTRALKQVHKEIFKGVSVHHLGLDAKYIVTIYINEGRRNSFDLNLNPDIEFRSTTTFQLLFKIQHGLEEVYEFKFARGLLAVGSREGVRIWDVEKRTSRDIKDDRMVEGCGVSVYGFNSKFIVGHLFSGPVLVWDLEAALRNPKLDGKSLLRAELKMRFDPDIRLDELEMVYLRRPHMEFLDEGMEEYDAGDHFEVIVKDFLTPDAEYQQCSEPCCLSDEEDYEM